MPGQQVIATPIVVVAASGLAREAAVAAVASGQRVRGVLDDRKDLQGKDIAEGLPVLGTIDEAIDHLDAQFVVCTGKGRVRRTIVERLSGQGVDGDHYVTITHPSVHVPPGCHVGPGAVLLAGVVLTADVSVGAHVVCMPHVVLTHDCVLAEYSTLCAGVVLGGGVRVERDAYVGMAASVRENSRIGEGSVVGMGSVVLQHVPAFQTWAGVPATPLRG
ncbi:NeuD/PglB/VioB family sugar acetyltransferase [Branchiibius cervicis]|uniref:NeuD/PglB/VioB family sugar acetyltransferase n=1 Tax=Branchiibius cervicis TaxID=908252 RepID=A0ABW2AU68_9MICO